LSEPTCADCLIWRRVTDAFGICRRFPPVPLVVEDGVRMFWSETRPDAWCAEHQPGGHDEILARQQARDLEHTEGNA
jgi:hypothetical protein